ncbi:MAG: ABC transporter substrate-binding protein, partial [Bacillota bacterium]|nr:ABC transporter substrate-binding protein [Bacillota bacterium]
VATLKGPTGMDMAEVMKENNGQYDFELASSPDEITGSIISGDIDIAAVPTNLAATLYQKTNGQIQIAAVNTLGVLYILEKGDSINSMADLSGKTILTAGQGTTAEYVLNYLKNALYIDENITVDFASEHSEVATKAQAGEYDIVVLPEPYVTSLTTADSDFRIALDLTEEWENTGAGQLAMGCLVVQKDFSEQNPEALADFMSAYERSVDYVNSNPAEAATDMESFDIIKAAVAEKAIPNCNIVYITGTEMQDALDSFYNVIFEADPQSVGGALPTEDLYLLNF